MTMPLVSVVMPVYNVAPYVEEAVSSILDQTFRDFELIVIDDGSTDGTGDIIDCLAGDDSRIRLVRQDNQGLVATLNRGCALASGKYIARMDGDDASFPTRFEKQVCFLEANPKVGICGTQAATMLSDGTRHGLYLRPVSDGPMKWYLMFGSCFAHVSVLIRSALLRSLGGYRDILAAEDYDLWARASEIASFANISEVLVRFRVRPEGQSLGLKDFQEAGALAIIKRQVERLLGRCVSAKMVHGLRHGIPADRQNRHADSLALARLLLLLYRAFTRTHILSRDEDAEIRKHLARRLWPLAGLSRGRAPVAAACLYMHIARVNPGMVATKVVGLLRATLRWAGPNDELSDAHDPQIAASREDRPT
jgi:hypothetical protein